MLVSLIPFFLAVRLAVDENAWTNGPEFVFNVDQNFTTTPVDRDGIQLYNHTTLNLYCRPKGSDSLVCHSTNAKEECIDLTNMKQVDTDRTDLKLIDNKTFEIKFNNHGIEYLIVDKNTFTYTLNTMKRISEMLNIGADLNGKPDGVFEEEETSTIGKCNVTFKIKHHPSKDVSRKMSSTRYELESLPQLNKVSGETIEIIKTRNLDNCSCYADYFYGIYGENTLVDDDVDDHLKSSENRIMVSDTKYVSSTVLAGLMNFQNNSTKSDFRETTTLTLADIRVAQGELPIIERRSKTSIVANTEPLRMFPVK